VRVFRVFLTTPAAAPTQMVIAAKAPPFVFVDELNTLSGHTAEWEEADL